MPLLSLPVELLHRIVYFTAASDQDDTDDCPCADIGPSHSEKAITRSCTPSDITALAHTCHHLRALSLPVMYSSVTAYDRFLSKIHTHLTTYPTIATFVRHITLYVGNGGGGTRMREILIICVNLQYLRLDGKNVCGPEETGYDPTLLLNLVGSSQRCIGLRGFLHVGLLHYIIHLGLASNEFHALDTIRLEDSIEYRHIPMYHPVWPDDNPLWPRTEFSANPTIRLSSVRKLILHTTPFRLLPRKMQRTIGLFLARTMPNVQVLALNVDVHCVRSLLDAYTLLGPNITDLTLHFMEYSAHVCAMVGKLAVGLRRFVAHGGTICHKLFEDTHWPCVVEVDIVGNVTCDGVEHDRLREGLMELVVERPQVNMRVVTNTGRKLVGWNQTMENDYMALLREFEEKDYHWGGLEVAEFGSGVVGLVAYDSGDSVQAGYDSGSPAPSLRSEPASLEWVSDEDE